MCDGRCCELKLSHFRAFVWLTLKYLIQPLFYTQAHRDSMWIY